MKKKKRANSQEHSAASAALEKALRTLTNGLAYTNPVEAYMAELNSFDIKSDESPVTDEQWEQLYEVTKTIRLLEPWKYLHESERITLLLPGRDEPVYVVVMGIGGLTYGIGIYPGYYSLRKLLKLTETEFESGNISVAFEQNCINLYFGDREELEAKDKKIIKNLGLKFRGRNEWPYFRSMKPGFVPWYINSEEADLAIAALQNFTMAFVSYAKGAIKVDFEDNETLLRFYSPDMEMWYNLAFKMPPAPFIVPRLIISDEFLIAKLKKIKKNKTKIGFLMSYIPSPSYEGKNSRLKMARVIALFDMDEGEPLSQTISDEYESLGSAIINTLADYIENNGKPLSISVPDEDTANYIGDFAKKVGIKLIESEKLMFFSNMLMDMMMYGDIEDFME